MKENTNEFTSKQSFSYTYSAAENERIREIKEKYSPQKKSEKETGETSAVNERKSKILEMERLDRSVENAAQIAGLSVGIAGTLTFGGGLSLVLKTWGILFAVGIEIGTLGIALMIAAYPIFKKVRERRKEKVKERILKLAEELEK